MVEYKQENNNLVCVFDPSMNTSLCMDIETTLVAKVAEAQGEVIFDLGVVDYVASAFFRLCLATAKKVGTERFVIVHVKPEVKKIFMIAGFGDLIRIE